MDDGIKFFNGLPVVCGAQRRRAGCGAGHIFDTLLEWQPPQNNWKWWA
ncbi:MAG TPA: hypothetical protein VIZ19_10170 [Roseiarcus sp.]|jgi:hypothetical protein